MEEKVEREKRGKKEREGRRAVSSIILVTILLLVQ